MMIENNPIVNAMLDHAEIDNFEVIFGSVNATVRVDLNMGEYFHSIYLDVETLEKWAIENHRLFQLKPVYIDPGIVADYEEVEIDFDTYLQFLDRTEIRAYFNARTR